MSAIIVDEHPTLSEALSIYQKLSANLGGSIARSQSDQNNDNFKQALGRAIADVSATYTKLDRIRIDEPAELFRLELTRYSEMLVKLSNLHEDMTLPYMLYVIGMGKAGKSSLLNSLVGSNVADIGTLPKTWKTDLFYKALATDHRRESVKILYRDGTIAFYSEQAAKILILDEENKREASEDLVDKEFRVRSKTLAKLDEKVILRKELQEQLLYRSPIREVRWALKNVKEKSVLNQFALVDTPGLSQNHANTQGEEGVRGENVGDFYHQADGVLWVLDAMTLSSSTPKLALENLEQSLAHANAGQKGIDNIIAVLNHSDKVIAQGGQEALTKVVEMARAIFGKKFLDFVPYSAKQAVTAVDNDDHALLETSGYNKLCALANQHFYFNAVDSRINSKTYGFSGEITTYQNDFFKPYLIRLAADEKKFQDRIEKAKKDLANLMQQLEGEWKLTFAEYERIVNQNIQTLAAQIVDLPESSHANFMEKQVFKMDLLKGYQSKYRSTSVGKVSETVEKYRKYDVENFARYKYVKNNALMALHTGNPLHGNEIAEKRIDFSGEDLNTALWGGALAGAGLLLLGPIGLLAGAFMMFGAKDRKINKAKESMRANLSTLEENCNNSNLEFLNTLKYKASDSLKSSAEIAFTSLHAHPDHTREIQSLFKRLNQLKTVEYRKETFAHLLFKDS